MRQSLFAVVAVTIFLGGTLALAQGAPANPLVHDVARKHYELGEKLYQMSSYPEALVEFEKAYKLEPLPALLFNIARCHEVMAHLEQAVAYYRRFLESHPGATQRPLVEARIANLERRIRERPASQPATARPAGPASRTATPSVPPAPPAPAGQEPQPRRWLSPVGWAALGVGAALLATGAALGALAKGKEGEYGDAVAEHRTYFELSEIEEQGERLEAAGIATLVAGGVLAAGGAGLLLWDRLGTRERRSAVVAPCLTATGATLTARVDF